MNLITVYNFSRRLCQIKIARQYQVGADPAQCGLSYSPLHALCFYVELRHAFPTLMQMHWFEIVVIAGGVEPPINQQRPLERLSSYVYLAFAASASRHTLSGRSLPPGQVQGVALIKTL